MRDQTEVFEFNETFLLSLMDVSLEERFTTFLDVATKKTSKIRIWFVWIRIQIQSINFHGLGVGSGGD